MKHLKLFENYTEGEVEFVVAKILDHFPYEQTKSQMEEDDDSDHDTILIDMINWFEAQYRDIENELIVMDRLKEEYDFLNKD
jgi:predicted hydrolase (HD superfamily)